MVSRERRCASSWIISAARRSVGEISVLAANTWPKPMILVVDSADVEISYRGSLSLVLDGQRRRRCSGTSRIIDHLVAIPRGQQDAIDTQGTWLDVLKGTLGRLGVEQRVEHAAFGDYGQV